MLIISPALTDGIDYAGMMTDQQHMGYVCHLGESTPPQGLIDGLKQTNWMQDTILEEMQVGRTGECSCATPPVLLLLLLLPLLLLHLLLPLLLPLLLLLHFRLLLTSAVCRQ